MPPSAPSDSVGHRSAFATLHLRLAGASQMRELGELGTIRERGEAQVRQRLRARGDLGADLRVLQRGVERPVEQEIQVTLRLRGERFAPRGTAA